MKKAIIGLAMLGCAYVVPLEKTAEFRLTQQRCFEEAVTECVGGEEACMVILYAHCMEQHNFLYSADAGKWQRAD